MAFKTPLFHFRVHLVCDLFARDPKSAESHVMRWVHSRLIGKHTRGAQWTITGSEDLGDHVVTPNASTNADGFTSYGWSCTCGASRHSFATEKECITDATHFHMDLPR